MNSQNISRRSFITIIFGGIGLAAFTFYGVATLNSEDFIKATLQRLIGKHNITDVMARVFCSDFINTFGEKKLYEVIILEEFPMLNRITDRLFLSRARSVDRFERKLVTHFLVSTNYLRMENPLTETLEYYGMNIPCNNPCANFDFLPSSSA